MGLRAVALVIRAAGAQQIYVKSVDPALNAK